MKKARFATIEERCFLEIFSFLKRDYRSFEIRKTYLFNCQEEQIIKSVHILGINVIIEISKSTKEVKMSNVTNNLFTRTSFKDLAEENVDLFVTNVVKLLETLLTSADAISDAKKNVWRAEERLMF